jgi:hypothetical protein
MPDYPINHHLYTFLWNKYRPAIVKLMVDALESPQEYKFLPHEFKDVNPKEKGGYWFTMEVYKGKAQNNIKGSVVAQDLLLTLQKSGRALEMFESSKFEFVLDKQFTLSVSQEPVVEEEEETTEDQVVESAENPSTEPSENDATDEPKDVAEEKETSKEEKEA